MGERTAFWAKKDLAEELTRAKAELDQLLGETPATRAVRGAYRNRAGRYANLATEPLARLERYRRTVPSSVSPDDMKRIRALVRAHGASQATNARNFVMDTWRRAIPGITAKLSERSKQSLARVVRGKWRLPALAAGAALGGGAAYGAAGLAKVAPPDDLFWGEDRQGDLFSPTDPQAEEKALASRLARMFRSWMDNPGRVGNAGDIAEALDPLYGILRSGAQSVPPPPDAGDSLAGMPESRELGVSFDLRSEEVERRLREYALDRIRAITQESRDAIRATLIEAAQSGLPIDEQARRIREAIGLSPGQQNWVSSYRAQLEALDPRALDRALRDRRHDSPIRAAIEAGTPLGADDIERYVASYQRRALAYRAMTIARTEALRGANTGMVEGARGMLADFPDVEVEKVWIATKDRRTRDAHAELDGKRVIGLDMPFQIRDPKTGAVEQIRWPHDPQASAGMVVNCRCTFGIRLIPKPGAGRFIADAA
jgi:hypothetical protein